MNIPQGILIMVLWRSYVEIQVIYTQCIQILSDMKITGKKLSLFMQLYSQT